MLPCSLDPIGLFFFDPTTNAAILLSCQAQSSNHAPWRKTDKLDAYWLKSIFHVNRTCITSGTRIYLLVSETAIEEFNYSRFMTQINRPFKNFRPHGSSDILVLLKMLKRWRRDMLKSITAIRLQISACKQSYFDSSFEFSASANWISIFRIDSDRQTHYDYFSFHCVQRSTLPDPEIVRCGNIVIRSMMYYEVTWDAVRSDWYEVVLVRSDR